MEIYKQETIQQSSISFRWGNTGTDVTIRYNDLKDLQEKINDVFWGIKEIKKRLADEDEIQD